MNFDIGHHFGAVQRSVSSATRDEQTAKTVTLTRSYPTGIDDLWSALTNSERIPRWFLPITGDLTHTAMVSEFWAQFGPGATGVGWETGLIGLDYHLINPNAPMMDKGQFSSSPEGRAFVAKSSEDWGRASIASGTQMTEALEAVKKITAFYTGDNSETS
jgi:hypothetical protein